MLQFRFRVSSRIRKERFNIVFDFQFMFCRVVHVQDKLDVRRKLRHCAHEYRGLLRIPSSDKLNRSVQGAHHSDRFQQAEMMSGGLVKSIATIRIYSTHPRLG